MTRRAYLYFALTFILGVVAGGAGVLFYGWHTGHWHRGFNRDRMVQRMSRDLRLSDAQVEQLKRIMDESGQKLRELRKQTAPQFEAVRQESQDRIRQILTPEQLTRFNEQVRRFEERRKKREPEPR